MRTRFLVMVVLVLAVGCSKELSRNQAADILEEMYDPFPIESIKCFGSMLENVGWSNQDANGNLSLTEKGKAHFQSVIADGDQFLLFKLKTSYEGKYRVKVTGITTNPRLGEAVKVVEFEESLEPMPDLGFLSEAGEYCHALKGSYAGDHRKVFLQRYDDGWREYR